MTDPCHRNRRRTSAEVLQDSICGDRTRRPLGKLRIGSMNADLDLLFKELAQSCPVKESMGKYGKAMKFQCHEICHFDTTEHRRHPRLAASFGHPARPRTLTVTFVLTVS